MKKQISIDTLDSFIITAIVALDFLCPVTFFKKNYEDPSYVPTRIID